MTELTEEKIKEVILRILNEEKERQSEIKDLKLELYELEQAGIYCDAERIKKIVDELTVLDPYPEEEEISQEDITAQKEKTMRDMREALRKQSIKKRNADVKKFIKRFSTISVVLVLLFTVSASAFGFNIITMLRNWGRELFSLGSNYKTECFASSLTESIYGEYDNVEEAREAFRFAVPIPSWIPEEYKLEKVQIVHYPTDIHVFEINYISSKAEVLKFTATIYHNNKTGTSTLFEKNIGEDPLIYPYSNVEHYIMFNNNNKILMVTWDRDNTIYTLHGNITVEEAQEIIKSSY